MAYKVSRLTRKLVLLTCFCFIALSSKLALAGNHKDEPLSAVELAATYWLAPDIIYYKTAGTELSLDVYAPKESLLLRGASAATATLPTIVYFHGGGWMKGDKKWAALITYPFLTRGWAVVSVSYRLGGQAHAPAAVEDARCAVRWVLSNAERYGFDQTRIVLMGRSAGGHLALMAGMLPVSAGLDYGCPQRGDKIADHDNATAALPEIKVAAIVNWFGITDVTELITGNNTKTYASRWIGATDNRMAIAEKVSPINHVRPGVPPVITIHGDKDEIVPYAQAVHLHRKLTSLGIPNRLVTLKGRGHLYDFSVDDVNDAYSAIEAFLAEHVE